MGYFEIFFRIQFKNHVIFLFLSEFIERLVFFENFLILPVLIRNFNKKKNSQIGYFENLPNGTFWKLFKNYVN